MEVKEVQDIFVEHKTVDHVKEMLGTILGFTCKVGENDIKTGSVRAADLLDYMQRLNVSDVDIVYHTFEDGCQAFCLAYDINDDERVYVELSKVAYVNENAAYVNENAAKFAPESQNGNNADMPMQIPI